MSYTTENEQLNNLMLLCTQNDITIEIDYNDVINDFARIKAGRKLLLFLSTLAVTQQRIRMSKDGSPAMKTVYKKSLEILKQAARKIMQGVNLGDVRRFTLNGLKRMFQSLVYADKPQTLDHLEDNIRRVIADIRPQMLEKVIENWTSRLDYFRASRGSPMPEIIFKI
ncbi:hypothetical protein TNCV_1885681 [Trichonephila clavipes]|nr:hypothetical protein TNCV_1885681 [Trichonephila clavipes]